MQDIGVIHYATKMDKDSLRHPYTRHVSKGGAVKMHKEGFDILLPPAYAEMLLSNVGTDVIVVPGRH